MSESFSFSSRGQAFHAVKWLVSDAKAMLCMVHGHGEHIERYDHVAQHLNSKGISCMGFDLYGHGKTEFKKGHWPSYEAVMDSIEVLMEQAKQAQGGKALFLYGHSMGGNIAANFVLRRKPAIKGLLLSAPWFRLAFKPSSTELFLAKMMLNIYPSFTQGSKLDVNAISRDAAEVEKYVKDPLVHDLISPMMFSSVHQSAQYAMDHAGELKSPLLLMHGDADRLTSHEASREFASKVHTEDLRLEILTDYFHEIHNESMENRAPVLELMDSWIQKRIPAS